MGTFCFFNKKLNVPPPLPSLLHRYEGIAAVRSQAGGFRQPKFGLDDICSLDERRHFVARVPPAHTFPTHAAVRAQNQALGGDVLQRLTDFLCDLLRPLDLQGVMVDHANGNFLLGDDFADGFDIHHS